MATLQDRAKRAESVLFQKYDELTALWLVQEKELTSLHIPRAVSYEYSSPCCEQEADIDPYAKYLGLVKINGSWRICHGELDVHNPQEGIDWTPITECSGLLRTQMARHLDNLRETVVKNSERFVSEVDKAIELLRKDLPQDPEVSLEELLADRAKRNGRHPKK